MNIPTKPLIGAIAAVGLLISCGSAMAYQSGGITEPELSGQSPSGACVVHFDSTTTPPAGEPTGRVETYGATAILPTSDSCSGGEGTLPGPPKEVIPPGIELPGRPKG